MLAETSPLPAVRSEPIATYAAQRPSSPPPSKALLSRIERAGRFVPAQFVPWGHEVARCPITVGR